MSYTKLTYQHKVLQPIRNIQNQTLDDNDITPILTNLNLAIDIYEKINNIDCTIGSLWNEIISDLISSINSALSGFYRPAIIVLRSILELGCMSIFYYDHKIEYCIFKDEDLKADKYVSTLVNEYYFFNTKYIKSFYKNIESRQSKPDSVSDYLKKVYAYLSDNVHGRYKSLTKVNELEINYDKVLFKRYEKLLSDTLSILAILYILRFDDTTNRDIVELANMTKVVTL